MRQTACGLIREGIDLRVGVGESRSRSRNKDGAGCRDARSIDRVLAMNDQLMEVCSGGDCLVLGKILSVS